MVCTESPLIEVHHALTWRVNTEQLGRVGHMQKDMVLPTGARKAILPLI